jgi:molybdopterin synthase catalytic subunit
MDERIHVDISEKPLSVAEACAFVADPAHGAVDIFMGAVRNRNLGRDVVGVSYDVHAPLARTTLRAIAEDVRARWHGQLKIYITHFKGRLDVGGVSVIIAVSSPHRDEAFRACRAVIEELKHRAPIWKQEHYTDGDSEWVQGHALCQHGHAHDDENEDEHIHARAHG